MSGTDKNTRAVIRRILSDIRVELGDEFDRNFERQAFFSDAWARRKSPTRPGGTILVDTGTLRRSVKSRTTDDSITFYTDLPYAAIHNDGGEMVVTEKMKRFFWHKYYEATGSFGRKKNGERRNDKRTRQLSTEADFWRFMALKRAGTTIRIPRRRFLGTGPEVERIVREIIEDNLNEYFNMDFSIERK
jgi:phage gpG-like protein